MKIEFLENPDQLRWRPKLNFLRVLVKSRRNKIVCGRVAVSVNYFIESGTPAHNFTGGKRPVAFDEKVSRGGEALARNLPVIVLTIVLVMFPGSTPARGATGALAGAGAGQPSAAMGDEEAAQGRGRRRSRKRRSVKRGQRMSQPKDNAKPHEAGESTDAAGQKKVDEAKKTQPPAPRPRRRYDPVLQPPERTRVP
jgi:hypothetical protein